MAVALVVSYGVPDRGRRTSRNRHALENRIGHSDPRGVICRAGCVRPPSPAPSTPSRGRGAVGPRTNRPLNQKNQSPPNTSRPFRTENHTTIRTRASAARSRGTKARGARGQAQPRDREGDSELTVLNLEVTQVERHDFRSPVFWAFRLRTAVSSGNCRAPVPASSRRRPLRSGDCEFRERALARLPKTCAGSYICRGDCFRQGRSEQGASAAGVAALPLCVIAAGGLLGWPVSRERRARPGVRDARRIEGAGVLKTGSRCA